MATHVSAEKRNRQNIKRRARNRIVRSKLHAMTKKVRAASKKSDGEALLKQVTSLLYKAAQKGILHRNTAGHRLSSLSRFVNQLS